ncbi:hypothetical protein [Streptomyces adustus]
MSTRMPAISKTTPSGEEHCRMSRDDPTALDLCGLGPDTYVTAPPSDRGARGPVRRLRPPGPGGQAARGPGAAWHPDGIVRAEPASSVTG